MLVGLGFLGVELLGALMLYCKFMGKDQQSLAEVEARVRAKMVHARRGVRNKAGTLLLPYPRDATMRNSVTNMMTPIMYAPAFRPC